MNYSTAITTDLAGSAAQHLLRADGQEDVCFASYFPSTGARRRSGVVADLILPRADERHVHGNAAFEAEFFLRAGSECRGLGAGLALLHSHPRGRGWQGMSRDDIAAERRHAAQAYALTGHPLLGLTMSGDGSLSARFWIRTSSGEYQRQDCESVRQVGNQLRVTFYPDLRPAPQTGASQERTVSAWGSERQADLARLRVGVIGAGSVGALVGEELARTGVENLKLIDFDSVEKRNLDRLLHAYGDDARQQRAKVHTLARGLQASSTAVCPEIEPLVMSVVEQAGFQQALDCDVLFSCVDRPWPRAVLNFVAYAHLIPVIDGGIAITAPGGRLRHASYRAHVAAPGRRCLACLGQFDPGLVQSEREGRLDDPAYIADLPDDHPVRRRENVFAFSAATAAAEVMQFLSMVVAPSGVADTGAQHFNFVSGQLDTDLRGCEPGCPYSEQLVAVGDSGPTVTGDHEASRAA